MKRSANQIFIQDRSNHLLFRSAAAGAIDTIGTLVGYALIWNVVSSDRGGYRVRLRPGSAQFAAEVHALAHHMYDRLLARRSNGTLRLYPDDAGVRVEIDLPNTTDGRDVLELVRRRDLTGMSFGIPDEPDYVETTVRGMTVRDYTRYLVDEVTITAIPAFEETSIVVKGSAALPVRAPAPAPTLPPPPPPVGYVDPAVEAIAVAADASNSRTDPRLIGYAKRRNVPSFGAAMQMMPLAYQRDELRRMALEMEEAKFASLTLPPAIR
jgi:HK97 family phage prohead protease